MNTFACKCVHESLLQNGFLEYDRRINECRALFAVGPAVARTPAQPIPVDSGFDGYSDRAHRAFRQRNSGRADTRGLPSKSNWQRDSVDLGRTSRGAGGRSCSLASAGTRRRTQSTLGSNLHHGRLLSFSTRVDDLTAASAHARAPRECLLLNMAIREARQSATLAVTRQTIHYED